MIVSSHIEKSKDNSVFKYNEPLYKNISNNLKDDSIVKADQIFSIPFSNIIFKIGQVDAEDYIRIMTAYANSIKEKEMLNV